MSVFSPGGYIQQENDKKFRENGFLVGGKMSLEGGEHLEKCFYFDVCGCGGVGELQVFFLILRLLFLYL